MKHGLLCSLASFAPRNHNLLVGGSNPCRATNATQEQSIMDKILYVFVAALSLGGLLQDAHAEDSAQMPQYLSYKNDPVQSLFSKALFGYAANEKCKILTGEQKSAFEEEINQAASFFGTYLDSKGILSSQSEFSSYLQEMIAGSALATGTLIQNCDDEMAKNAVGNDCGISTCDWHSNSEL
jgi:hypothetical protein